MKYDLETRAGYMIYPVIGNGIDPRNKWGILWKRPTSKMKVSRKILAKIVMDGIRNDESGQISGIVTIWIGRRRKNGMNARREWMPS